MQHSVVYVSNCAIRLSAALSAAVEAGLLSINPAAKAKRPKIASAPDEYTHNRDRAWSRETLTAILAAVEEYPLLSSLCRVLATTGMRRGEIMGFYDRDWNPDQRTLYVRHNRTQGHEVRCQPVMKTEASRRAILVSEETAATITAWMQSRCSPVPCSSCKNMHLFVGKDGSALTPFQR